MVAAAGVGAYAFPLIVPWHIIFLLTAVLTGASAVQAGLARWGWALLSFLVIVAVLRGDLSSTLAAAMISAATLAVLNFPAASIAVMVMNLAVAGTAQEMLADAFHKLHIEAAGPAIIAIAILSFANRRVVLHATVFAALSVMLAWAANQLSSNPTIPMALASLPACGFAILVVRRSARSVKHATWPIFTALLACIFSWAWTPPRSINDVYVLLPISKSSPESKFFDRYVEALRFAGLKGIAVTRPDDVPTRALLLLPWLTSPLGAEKDDPVLARISTLARERAWTVVAAGEHTNMGGVAKRIADMSGRQLLRSDLTVPPNNTDDSGPLRSSDIRAWRHDSILNRGASVQVNSIFDRVLVSGDGWWAEPDIGEWLWVGDYIWRKGERAGRLALATVSDVAGARWVVLGDNSPLINNQIIADPRAAVRILELATLWPAFAMDALILSFSILILVPALRRSHLWSIGCLLSLISTVGMLRNDGGATWKDYYVGESGFEDRNFNVVMAESPALVAGNRLIRVREPMSGAVELPLGHALIFGLVDNAAKFGEIMLYGCRRIGSLKTTEGPTLMDAQACQVEGDARVLIGTKEAAAAIAVSNGQEEVYVFLDKGFLGRLAPEENRKWLLREIEHWRTIVPQK